MRKLLLLSGLAMIGIGIASLMVIEEKATAISFFKGAITLGGAWLICVIYMRQSHWHGVIGGGIVALLSACRSWWNLPNWLQWVVNQCPMPATPLLELFTAIISSVIVITCVRILLAEKTRRLVEGRE
jgi:hypothetical protein